MTEHGPRTLRDGFLRSADRLPDRPALEVGGQTLSYAELRDRAGALAATLRRELPAPEEPLTAVFGSRSATAFAGVLGALMRGHGYVPLNPKFPVDRSRVMLERAGCGAVIVDAGAAAQLDELLDGVERPLVLLLPELEDVAAVARRWPQHTVLGARRPCRCRRLGPRARLARRHRLPAVHLRQHRDPQGRDGRPPQRPRVHRRDGRALRHQRGGPLLADLRPDLRPVGLRHVPGLGARRVRLLPARERADDARPLHPRLAASPSGSRCRRPPSSCAS